VIKGLAGIKFSTSPRINGSIIVIIARNEIIDIIPRRSLIEKKGWNGILSILEFTPRGLLEPVWCKNKRWIIDSAVTTNGRRKCKAKNRVNVALSIENPPQIHCTISGPI